MSNLVKSKIMPSFSPFIHRVICSKHDEFDKYYDEIQYKEVYRKAGVDAQGEEYGTIVIKPIVTHKDISEFINSQADTVGVEAYMKALAIQGVSGDDFFTNVDLDKVQDFTDAPDNKFDGVLYGKKAVELFNGLDPALKGKHTTIEGFLGSLNQEIIDAYIKGKVDAAFPKKEVKKDGE